MLDLEYLAQLVILKEKGTLAAVSEYFHISQPTITRNMKTLESYYDVPLFKRQNNRIELNDNGEYLYEMALQLLSHEKQAKEMMHRYDTNKKTINVASCLPHTYTKIAKNIIRKFNMHNILTTYGHPHKIMTGFEIDEYQIALLPGKINKPEYVSKQLYSDELLILLPIDHPLAVKTELKFEELNGLTILLYKDMFWNDVLAQNIPNSCLIIQEDETSLKELVLNSNIPTLITKIVYKTIIKNEKLKRIAIPLKEEGCTCDYYVVYKEKDRDKFDDINWEL